MIATKIFGWIMLGVSVFLVTDAALAAIFGKRYMQWGLNHLPMWYGGLIGILYNRPKIILLAAILAEFAIGLWLFFMARTLVITYNPL